MEIQLLSTKTHLEQEQDFETADEISNTTIMTITYTIRANGHLCCIEETRIDTSYSENDCSVYYRTDDQLLNRTLDMTRCELDYLGKILANLQVNEVAIWKCSKASEHYFNNTKFEIKVNNLIAEADRQLSAMVNTAFRQIINA